LTVTLTLTNRSREPLSVDLRWAIDADFADLQEAERAPAILVAARAGRRAPSR
jgi:hypothetical protein